MFFLIVCRNLAGLLFLRHHLHTALLSPADLASLCVAASILEDEEEDVQLLQLLHVDREFVYLAGDSLPADATAVELAVVSLLKQLPVTAQLVPVKRRSGSAVGGVSLLPVIGGGPRALPRLLSSQKEVDSILF